MLFQSNKGHRQGANWYEQTILLTTQTHNSLAYERRMIVLSKLILISTKVK